MHEHHHVGDWDGALGHYRQAAAGFHEAGDLRRWGAAMTLMSGILRARGDMDESLALARQAARVGEEGGDRQVLAWGLGEEGRSLLQMGRPEEAVRRIGKARKLLDSIPDYLSLIAAYGDLGRIYLAQGRIDEALRAFEGGQRMIAARRLRAFLCSPCVVGEAAALLAAAEACGADERSSYLKRARRACAAAVRQGRLDREAGVAAYRCRGTYAWLRGRRGRALYWWRKSIAAAERLGADYERGLTLLERGARAGERGSLEEAQRIFEHVGAGLELARVRLHLADAPVEETAAPEQKAVGVR
jgi:tetratricopeptide (TPR) repeat protein